MKSEIINSIAKEIFEQACFFRDQVVMKELKEKGVLFDLSQCFNGKIFPGIPNSDFANIYSHTVIFVLLSAALSRSLRSRKNALNTRLLKNISRLSM